MVMAVVRVAVMVRKNLSCCILCGGIYGLGSGGCDDGRVLTVMVGQLWW